MTEDKLNRLKEVLAVVTHSKQEEKMIQYLSDVFETKGYDYEVDDYGNVYVTKGVSEAYPLFVAHTDTVHDLNDNLTIKEYVHNGEGHTDKVALTGYDSVTNLPSGCGGDDKCGVYLALEMLDTYENVKAAFFVSEEIGCIGSRAAVKTKPEFFADVAYAIQYDSPEGDSLSSTLMGKYLFESSEEFTGKVKGLITEAGVTKWANHPYTDIWPLLDEFDFCCLNLAAGYYRMHTAREYVIVDDVQNAYDLGIQLVEALGEVKYHRPEKTYNWYDSYKSSDSDTDSGYNYGGYYRSRGNKTSNGWSRSRDVGPQQDTYSASGYTPQVLSEATEEDKKRVRELYQSPLSEWSDDDWDFYENYDGADDWGDIDNYEFFV